MEAVFIFHRSLLQLRLLGIEGNMDPLLDSSQPSSPVAPFLIADRDLFPDPPGCFIQCFSDTYWSPNMC